MQLQQDKVYVWKPASCGTTFKHIPWLSHVPLTFGWLSGIQFEVQWFKWLVLIDSCASGISVFHYCISECLCVIDLISKILIIAFYCVILSSVFKTNPFWNSAFKLMVLSITCKRGSVCFAYAVLITEAEENKLLFGVWFSLLSHISLTSSPITLQKKVPENNVIYS